MKILHILPEMNAGGVELCTLELSELLVGLGHQVVVVSHGGRLVERLVQTGARHIVLPVHRKSLKSLSQVRPLRRLLEIERPDILHIHSRVPGWLAWLAWRKMPKASRPRLVSTVHGFYSVSRYSAIMTKGERVIAVSRSIRNYILESYPRVAPSNIRVVLHGIDSNNPELKERPSEKWLADWHEQNPGIAGKQLLLLPGRITRLKGHDDYFRLIAALKAAGMRVHGLVAGDTHVKKRAYLEELHGLVLSLGIADDVTFLGHRTDIREVMWVSDCICALSQKPESFGRTVLEALALGRPVVGYDCGGVGELLGTLFPAGRVPRGDPDRLLENAISILRGVAGPLPVGPPFTLDAMSRSTLAVYQELMG